jgi:hypothetical protein
VLLPSPTEACLVLGMVKTAFAPVGGLDELQETLLEGIATSVYVTGAAGIAPATDEQVAASTHAERLHAMHLLVVLELVEHPLRPEVASAVEGFAKRLDVSLELLRDARHLAHSHFVWTYLDLQRHSWYEEETIKESLSGRWRELVRSKLAYEGILADAAIANRWTGLRDCPAGSWGRGVADFYDRHGFPFPGERFGIYELGARHDWVHVLAGYDTTPQGELDVFAFIAASMDDERGLVLLAITLGLFQNGSIRHVAGRRIGNARSDALNDAGGVTRFAEALRRGNSCATDVMGTVDLFALRDEPLADVRSRFGVLPPARSHGDES